jgi:hypothetical protein
MKRRWKAAVMAGVLCLCVGFVAGAQLGNILKAGGVAIVVDKFGPDINKFINRLTGEKNVGPLQETKVVPIISVGDGGFIGAVQVSGPDAQVKKVQAVAQIEGRFKVIGGVRIRALIPVSTKSPNKSISRVEGVGVSAIVDIKI